MLGDRRYVPLPDYVARAMVDRGELDVPLLSTHAEPRAIVLGTRRAAALKAHLRPNDQVPVLVASRSSEVLAWLEVDGPLHGHGGLPWSWVQRARVYGVLSTDVTTRGGEPAMSVPLATYLGTYEGQLRHAWYLVRDFDRTSGEEKVQLGRAIRAVETGELLPQSATHRLKSVGFPDPDAPRAAPTMTAAEQRKRLENLGHVLAGASLAIDSLGTIHRLPADDPLLEALRKSRRDIARLTRALAPTDTRGEGNDEQA